MSMKWRATNAAWNFNVQLRASLAPAQEESSITASSTALYKPVALRFSNEVHRWVGNGAVQARGLRVGHTMFKPLGLTALFLIHPCISFILLFLYFWT